HVGSRRATIIALVFASVSTLLASASSYSVNDAENETIKSHAGTADSLKSVAAFKKVYSVLMSPRCVNCHPAGDIPLQGDDSHLHAMAPKRGADGKGILTMKCTNCHQPENTDGLHMPPGNAEWHLPPADMKMVFEGKTPHQLAKQLVDREQNGNKDKAALIAHADDSLVLWGWNPGEGRTLPPLSHAEFKEAWIIWLNTGAYAPAEN
ncbi:Isoquinoline 1-oxidoreductase subunit, partial [Brucella sp. 21LCYQ03]|nr:Isoquinoline 1-oxidoreductase subunit [Brucella sp. 21LCYQ03]